MTGTFSIINQSSVGQENPSVSAGLGAVQLADLRCEYLTDPLGMDIRRPRLSWQLRSGRHGVRQNAYQVVVAKTDASAEVVWDSGKVPSDNSIQVEYGGLELQSRQRYCWRVRIWDEQEVVSNWSPSAFWEMGLLTPADWQAEWIEPVQDPAIPEPKINMFQNLGTISPQPDSDYSRLNPCLYLRKTFTTQGSICKARIYATAHGVYRLEINGVRVGSLELAPEVTAYQGFLQYQTYDVGELLIPGANVIGAVLGDGWYRGRIGLPGDSCQYGDKLALLLQLEVEYSDGRRQWVNSDPGFKSSSGPLVYSDLFIGERYDAGLELGDWHLPTYDDQTWQPALKAGYGYANLAAQYGEPLQAVLEISPAAILVTPKGETVVDLGQNISGRLRMRVQGPAKTIVTLDHAEMLDADGNFMQAIRGRNKDQRDIYILKGDGIEVYEPWFTTHGFRYVRISGYPGEPRREDFCGVVIASGLRDTGSFLCSDERLNRLQENIRWSQRGNFVSIPTDCPQRERAGFTGDAQIFGPTACFNMDVAAFFTRWLRSLRLEQRQDGQVPACVPYWNSYIEMFTPMQGGAHTSAGWGDACIIIPWTLYQVYGDIRVLQENYSSMVRWLDYVRREAEQGIPERLQGELPPEVRERQKYLWNTGFHFGDWLIPSLTGGYKNPFEAANATKEIAASCFYACCTDLMAQIASILQKPEDQHQYAALNASIRQAFAAEYLSEEGRLSAHYQGMYVLALQMNVVPKEKRSQVTEQLVGLIIENGDRLDTGFVSGPYLLDVLSANGRRDMAYKLLFQTECPSWLYEVERGATTIWEVWDAVTPQGQISTASFNHYAFGCVGDWLYRFVAGLDKDQAGYKHILIQPDLTGGLTHASASYRSGYGEIISAWELQQGRLTVQVQIPPNTSASIRLPGAGVDAALIWQQCSQGLLISQRQDGETAVLEVGSGAYRFEYQVDPGEVSSPQEMVPAEIILKID